MIKRPSDETALNAALIIAAFDLKVTVIAPCGGPGVLHQPIICAILSAIANHLRAYM